jgi:Recombination endonuclease VII
VRRRRILTDDEVNGLRAQGLNVWHQNGERMPRVKGRPESERLEMRRNNARNYRKNNPNKYWRAVLAANYGVPLEWYKDKEVEQGNGCAICGQPEIATRNGTVKRLAVDHNHATGQVRGLLCSRCNVKLGHIEDRHWLAKAEAYLVKYERADTNGLVV